MAKYGKCKQFVRRPQGQRASFLQPSFSASKLICKPCCTDYQNYYDQSNIKINLPALFHRLSTLRTNYMSTTSAACTRFWRFTSRFWWWSSGFWKLTSRFWWSTTWGLFVNFNVMQARRGSYALLRGTGSNILLLSLILYISSSLKELSYFH